jgi:hypothetical protein
LQSTSAGITVTTPRGDIQVVTPSAFADLFGTAAPDVSNGARLAAFRLVSSDMKAAAASLSSGGFAPIQRMGRLVVPADQALGAALVFEAAH